MNGEMLLGFSLHDIIVFGLGYFVGFNVKIAVKFGSFLIKRHKKKVKRQKEIAQMTDYSSLSTAELKEILRESKKD